MKKWLFFSLLIVSINIFSQSSPVLFSSNSEGSPITLNLLLSITHNDKNIIDPLKSTLASMGGITIVAYCDNHAVLMLSVDKSIYRDEKDLMRELKKYYPKSEDLLSFKDGDFKEFIQYCQPKNTDDASNLKKLVTN